MAEGAEVDSTGSVGKLDLDGLAWVGGVHPAGRAAECTGGLRRDAPAGQVKGHERTPAYADVLHMNSFRIPHSISRHGRMQESRCNLRIRRPLAAR